MARRMIDRRTFLKGVSLGGMGLVLGACGAQEQGVNASTDGSKPASGGAQAPGSTTTQAISLWYNADNHKAEYEKRVAEINKKFNVDLKLELLTSDAQLKKLQATLMSGSGTPDICELNAEDMVKFLKGTEKAIPFLALNDVLKDNPYYPQVLESRWARYTKDGKIFGAPHDVHPMLMLYNDKAWQSFGVDLSKLTTWKEFLDACAKVDKKMPDGSARYALMDSPLDQSVPARMLEQKFWWTDDTGKSMLGDPRFKAIIEDALQFKPYYVDIDWTNQVAMMKAGQAMTELTPDWLYGIHKQGTAKDTELLKDSPMRLMRIPGIAADDPRVSTWGGTTGTVMKMSPNKELATQIMLYLYFENGEKQLEERYKSIGILPPVKSCWDGEAFHTEDPYVGGQKAGEVFIEAAGALPSYSESWTTELVKSAWREQSLLLWADQTDVDTAIASAIKSAEEQIAKNS